MDTCAPFQEPACCSKQYFLCVITTPHRYVRAIFILNNSDKHELCVHFIAWLENEFKIHIGAYTMWHLDGACVKRKVLNRTGTVMTISSPYRPHSSNLSKRMNKILIDKPRALRKKRHHFNRYWSEPLFQGAYFHNRTNSPELKLATQ